MDKKRYGFYPGCSHDKEAGYKESVDLVCDSVGLQLTELPDWNCCGATATMSLSSMDAVMLSARNFAIANQQKFDTIVTPCNACYMALKKAHKHFSAHPDVLKTANDRLPGEGLHFESLPAVRHLADVLANDVEKDVWKERIVRNVTDISAAAYYGCQFTRPWGDVGDPENPQMLEHLLQNLDFSITKHSAKTQCCGASHVFSHEKECFVLIKRILNEIRRKGADIITTICPLCQMNLEAAQLKLDEKPIPVLYFTQAIGLAMGLPLKNLGIHKLLNSADSLVKRLK